MIYLDDMGTATRSVLSGKNLCLQPKHPEFDPHEINFN